MRHRILVLSLVLAVMAATCSAFSIPTVQASKQAELRYGTPEAVRSNGLTADEYYARFAALREQKSAGNTPTPSTVNVTTSATAVDNPPSTSEVRASSTTNWLGFTSTVQNMGAAEEIYMAWPDDRDSMGDAGVYFTRSLDGGQTWSSDVRVDRSNNDAGTAGISLDMITDNHGNIVITWDDERNGTPAQVFYSVSHDRGSTWSSAVPVDTDSELSLFGGIDLAVDPSGNFYVTWQDLRPGLSDFGVYSASSFDRGDTWTNEVKVSDQTGTVEHTPRIAATRDREVVITWVSDRLAGAEDDMFMARSTDGGATFTADQQISSNPAGALLLTNNKMCSDGNGTLYVIYGLTTGGVGDVYVVVSNDFGLSWTSQKKITGARYTYSLGGGVTAVNCSFDGLSGHAAISFAGSTDGSTIGDVFVSTSSDSGASWSSAERVNTGLAPLSSNITIAISIGIDTLGHVVVVWNDNRTGTFEIYFNYSNSLGASWASTDIRLNGGTPGAHDAFLTSETLMFLAGLTMGSNGTNNTNRLAFHSTFNDDRAGAEGMYDGIIEFAGDMQVMTRLAGATRIETSIAINQDLFPVDGTAPAVVIGTSENFADGLAAGPLAAMLNGSLLLNPQDALHPAVALEISRVLDLKPSPAVNVYIVGGPAAISDTVLSQIQATSPHIRMRRISGQNRYETSVRVAEQIDDLRGSGPTGVMITTGENFPDALSASAPASDPGINPGQMPILLVTRTGLEPEIHNYLVDVKSSIEHLYVIGGTAAVSDGVSSAAAALIPGVIMDRLAGLNRYETATAVANFFYTGAMAPQGIGLASGEKFPDALGGGRASGAKHRPMILTTKSSLPVTSAAYVSINAGTLDTGDAYGGTAVIDESIIGLINLSI